MAHLCAPRVQVRTRTNRSGGIQGGLSNGEDIVIRVAFKPTSTIGIKQKTVGGRVGLDGVALGGERGGALRWFHGG